MILPSRLSLLQWLAFALIASLNLHFSCSYVLPASNTSVKIYSKSKHFTSKNSENQNNDESSPSPSDTDINSSSPSQTKPMSRLAMAAADWMEEEDELQTYWDRYDTAKSSKDSKNNVSSTSTIKSAKEEEILTTDERLDRYFQSRGIDKSVEKKYANDIERAIAQANSASSPLDAIQILEKVRSYLQVGSKLGGTALLELAFAYQAYDAELENNEYEDKFKEICHAIIENNPLRELRLQAKQLLEDPKRYGKKYERRDFWQMFDSWWG